MTKHQHFINKYHRQRRKWKFIKLPTDSLITFLDIGLEMKLRNCLKGFSIMFYCKLTLSKVKESVLLKFLISTCLLHSLDRIYFYFEKGGHHFKKHLMWRCNNSWLDDKLPLAELQFWGPYIWTIKSHALTGKHIITHWHTYI